MVILTILLCFSFLNNCSPNDFYAKDLKRILKLNGLLLTPDATVYVNTLFGELEPKSRDATVKRFVDAILARNLDVNRVSKCVCESIVREWNCESTQSDQFIYIVNAFNIPRFRFCQRSKKFVTLQTSVDGSNSLLPQSPATKAFLSASRYEAIYQRVLRNPVFACSDNGFSQLKSDFRLRPIEFLLAMGAKENNVVILGMLVQLKNGQWHLEDPTSLVKLDLSNATFHQGLFPEGAIVLAEGSYNDEIFHVSGIGLPPVEKPENTRRYFAVNNPFGGSSIDGPAAAVDSRMVRLLKNSQVAADCMLVLLGETRLDVPGCLDHLDTIFMGYGDFPPAAFVVCGDFVNSNSTVQDKRELLKQLFQRLCRSFLRIYGDSSAVNGRRPKLILVVGPNDPSLGPKNLLPRPPLLPDLFDNVPGVEKLAGGKLGLPDWLHLASNPVRIRLYTREIVIFRYDYCRQLLRHCVHLPSSSIRENASESSTEIEETGLLETPLLENSELDNVVNKSVVSCQSSAAELGLSLARCLASQAHLTPLPVHVSPVFWAWDQALSLNPLPDLVVAVEPDSVVDLNAASSADATKCALLGGCSFANPGRFGCTSLRGRVPTAETEDTDDVGGEIEYTFKVYYPSTNTLEDSRLPS